MDNFYYAIIKIKGGDIYMGPVLYRKWGYIIFKARRGFVVYNTSKQFENGHTHLNNFQSCKDAIGFCVECRVPLKAGLYYLTSLQRITKNKLYWKALEDRKQELIELYNLDDK